MKRALTTLVFLCCVMCYAFAQMVNPVTWKTQLVDDADDNKAILFQATIEEGWHLYSMDVPEDGPSKTEFTFENVTGAELIGNPVVSQGEAITHFDDSFEMDLTYYENSVTFKQVLRILSDDYSITGEISYMSCNDGMCTPPTREEFSLSAGAANAAGSTADNTELNPASLTQNLSNSPLWTPVIDKLQSFDEGNSAKEADKAANPWWLIFIFGFGAGLLALITPCVWPMIPMTVSFFLKRTKDRRKSIRDAYTYGISIIVIYVALGLIITGFFGASALNDLATNAIFNIIFFLMLVVFGVSFLGAFEISLPASWTTKLDEKADSATGMLSIFFMAFTLCLVSFSCTGPIIGTLLVEAATSGSYLNPAIGMFGFALALSIPFTLCAVFPSMLKSMPKSGGWLNAVKVVLGLLELALSLKFLSVADLAYGWGILDREVFVSLWIVIFAVIGFYLIGKIKFAHDTDEGENVSTTRFMMALISFAFAIYMVPGLWGAPLKAISAFAPPLSTQDFNLYTNGVEASYNDYEEGMAAARKVGKPVLVDFSGFGCVNCRKMEAAVWTDSQVKNLIDNDYILISLMVDDKTPLPVPVVITENGKQVTLKTVGDKWSYLQRYKFGANAQPFHVLLNNEGEPVAPSHVYDEDVAGYVKFLEEGLKNYRN